MQDTKVIHLVSNSLTHPENTASEFKVSYNKPFDFTGKKIALTDVTLTRAHPNVLEEKITFEYSTPITLAPHTVVVRNSADIGEWVSLALFLSTHFQSYKTYLKNSNNRVLLAVDYLSPTEDAPNEFRFPIHNMINSEIKVEFNSFAANSARGWEYATAFTFDQGKKKPMKGNVTTYPQEKRKHYIIKLKPQQKITLTMKIHEATFNKIEQNPDTYSQFRKDIEVKIHTFKPVIRTRPHDIFQPGPAYYKSIEALLGYFNNQATFRKLAQLALVNDKVQFTVKPAAQACNIKLGGFEKYFGFDTSVLVYGGGDHEQKFTAQRLPDMTGGTHHFYIYCSLVKEVAVNEQMLPILATVDATQGVYGQQMLFNVKYPLFLNCVDGPQQQIEVVIADDIGNKKGLLMGRTKLTLVVTDEKR